MKNTTLINGKEAVIEYRQSRSTQKDEPKINATQVMEVLEWLLQGDRSKKYKSGITTLRTFSTKEAITNLSTTRVSNQIGELRKVMPKSGILMFKYLDEKLPRYALINDEKIIESAEDMLSKIKRELSLKL